VSLAHSLVNEPFLKHNIPINESVSIGFLKIVLSIFGSTSLRERKIVSFKEFISYGFFEKKKRKNQNKKNYH